MLNISFIQSFANNINYLLCMGRPIMLFGGGMSRCAYLLPIDIIIDKAVAIFGHSINVMRLGVKAANTMLEQLAHTRSFWHDARTATGRCF